MGLKRALNQNVIEPAWGEDHEMGSHGAGYELSLQDRKSFCLINCRSRRRTAQNFTFYVLGVLVGWLFKVGWVDHVGTNYIYALPFSHMN